LVNSNLHQVISDGKLDVYLQTYQNAKDYILSVFILFSSGLHYVNLMGTTFLCLVPFMATKGISSKL